MAKLIAQTGKCCKNLFHIDGKKGETHILTNAAFTDDNVKHVFVDNNRFTNKIHTNMRNKYSQYKIENNTVVLLQPLSNDTVICIETF